MYGVYQQLLQHFDARDVRYRSNTETLSLSADFRLDFGTCRVIVAIDAEDRLLQVFGYSPVRVPVGARPMVAEAIGRANFGLRVGKLELDFSDGEMRFQACQLLADDHLDDDVIGRMMGTTMACLEMYLPAMMSVVVGNETPEDAIRCAEAAQGRSAQDPTDPTDRSDGSDGSDKSDGSDASDK